MTLPATERRSDAACGGQRRPLVDRQQLSVLEKDPTPHHDVQHVGGSRCVGEVRVRVVQRGRVGRVDAQAHEVGLLADLQRADAVVEPQHAGAAEVNISPSWRAGRQVKARDSLV